MISRLSTAIIVTMLVILAASLPAKAVVLTFNPSDGVTGDASLLTYGDNVASSSQGGFTYYNLGEGWAPDVSLSFTSTAGSYQTYNDAVWTGVIYNDGRYVTFTPENADTSVKINDLNLESYGSGSISFLRVVTFDNSGVENGTLLDVVSTPTSVVSGPVGQLFTVNYTGAPGQTIGLTFGGSGSNVGINSLRFTEVVPEPASLSLLGLGSLLALRRKRR